MELLKVGILMALGQQTGSRHGWIVSGCNDTIDFIAAGGDRALNFSPSDALLRHVGYGLDDMNVWVFGHNLVNAFIPKFRVHIRYGLKNVQDIPFIAHDLDQIFSGSHRSTFDIGSDRERDRCGCMRLPAIGYHQDVMPF